MKCYTLSNGIISDGIKTVKKNDFPHIDLGGELVPIGYESIWGPPQNEVHRIVKNHNTERYGFFPVREKDYKNGMLLNLYRGSDGSFFPGTYDERSAIIAVTHDEVSHLTWSILKLKGERYGMVELVAGIPEKVGEYILLFDGRELAILPYKNFTWYRNCAVKYYVWETDNSGFLLEKDGENKKIRLKEPPLSFGECELLYF